MFGGVFVTKEDDLRRLAAKWDNILHVAWQLRSRSADSPHLDDAVEKFSSRQIDILIILFCMDINTVSEMAEFLKISKSTLSIIMNKLVARGLVTREYPDGGDRRRVYFKISEKGKEIAKRMNRHYIDGLSKGYMSFNEEERGLFREGIACFRKACNAKKTLFAIMSNKMDYADYADGEVVQIAQDIAYFFINIRLNNPDIGNASLPDNITPNRFYLLACISEGMDSVSKLQKHIGSSVSTLSIGVSKLVEQGYLVKEYPDLGDRRNVYISITEKGIKVLEDARFMLEEKLLHYISSMTDENIKIFEHGCDCLIKALQSINNV